MKSLGKSIVLLMLIIIKALGGLLWFDYLGVVRVKTVFTPLYKLMGKTPQTSETASSSADCLFFLFPEEAKVSWHTASR